MLVYIDFNFISGGKEGFLVKHLGHTINVFANIYFDIGLLIPTYLNPKTAYLRETLKVRHPEDRMSTSSPNSYGEHACFQLGTSGHINCTGTAGQLKGKRYSYHQLSLAETSLNPWVERSQEPLNGVYYTTEDKTYWSRHGKYGDHWFCRVKGFGQVPDVGGVRDAGVGLTPCFVIERQWVNNDHWPWTPSWGHYIIDKVTLLSSGSNYCAALFETFDYNTVNTDPGDPVSCDYRASVTTIVYGSNPGSTDHRAFVKKWDFAENRWSDNSTQDFFHEVKSKKIRPNMSLDQAEFLPGRRVMADTLAEFGGGDLSEYFDVAYDHCHIERSSWRFGRVREYVSNLSNILHAFGPTVVNENHDGTYYKVLNGECFDSIFTASMNSLAYIRDGIGMLTGESTVRQLITTATDLLKGARGLEAAKSFADLLLSGKYGDKLQWLDTVQTCQRCLDKAFAVLPDESGWYVTHASKTFGGTQVVNGYQFDWSDHWHSQVSYRDADLGLFGAEVRALRSSGLMLTLTNAWDLIPYSFVVDWFINVQSLTEVLDRYTYYAYYEYRRNIVSTKVRVEMAAKDVARIACQFPELDKFYISGTVHYKRYNRAIDQPFSLFTFDRTLAPGFLDNTAKRAVAGALIVQRL